MFDASVTSSELQGELARLRADGRDRSLGELVDLVGECQSVINQAAALQMLAMAHVAAIEDVVLEDGTMVEQHRGLGHERLDAPALVSDQLGVSDAVAGSRLGAAVDLVTRVPGVFAAMGEGRLDEYRARVVGEELRDAAPETCALVVARIADGLGSEPAAALRRRVRRVLGAVDPDLMRAKASRARSERSLRRWPGDEPGVDTWMGSFPAEMSRSGWAVVDGLAREYVRGGRATGVEQARADALMDLIHSRATGTFVVQLAVPADQLAAPDQLTAPDRRTVTPHESVGDTAPTTIRQMAEPRGKTVPTEAGPAVEAVAGSAAGARDADTLVTVAGLGMPGTTQVLRSWLDTLGDAADSHLDTTSHTTSDTTSDTSSDGAAGIAPTVRHEVVACDAKTGALLAAATDPDRTGRQRVIESKAYRPPSALVDLVRARDGQCRFPGCTVNARFCDLDHVRPWPLGPTDAANLMCLCRRHHRIKQTVRWRVRIEPNATVTWTDPTGRVRSTLPTDFLQRLDGEPPARVTLLKGVGGPERRGPEQREPTPPEPEHPERLHPELQHPERRPQRHPHARVEAEAVGPVDAPGVLWSVWEEELAHELSRAERHRNRRRVVPDRAEGLATQLTTGRVRFTLDRAYARGCPGRTLRRPASLGDDPPF